MSKSLYKPFTTNTYCWSIPLLLNTKTAKNKSAILSALKRRIDNPRYSKHYFKLADCYKNVARSKNVFEDPQSMARIKIGSKVILAKPNMTKLLEGALWREIPAFASFSNKSYVTPAFCEKKVAFYNGKTLTNFTIKRAMIGCSFTSLVRSKRTGRQIHIVKKSQKK